MTILAFGLIIVVHELGHFLGARAAGVRVEEFAIGFGPPLLRWRSPKTLYSLRLLVILGGYVRMAGMDAASKDPADRGAFYNKTVRQRALVFAAGPAMNFILAVILFFVVFGVVGVAGPTLEVAEVRTGYPAATAGIRPGDEVLAVDGRPVADWAALVAAIQGRAGQEVRLLVARGAERLHFEVVPIAEGGRGLIGIVPASAVATYPPLTALGRGFGETFAFTVAWIRGLALIIAGRGAADVTGPVGIARMLGQAASVGASNFLFLLALVSVNIGLANLLPIPVLDGSRLVFLGVEAVRGRPIDPRRENLVHLMGFMFLMALFVILTYRDLLQLLRG